MKAINKIIGRVLCLFGKHNYTFQLGSFDNGYQYRHKTHNLKCMYCGNVKGDGLNNSKLIKKINEVKNGKLQLNDRDRMGVINVAKTWGFNKKGDK